MRISYELKEEKKSEFLLKSNNPNKEIHHVE